MFASQSNEVEKRAVINSADDFTELLNKRVKNKAKYDKHYKSLTFEQSK